MKSKTNAECKESEELPKKAYEELLMFQNVNNALNSSMELSEILQAIVDGLTEVFGYYSSGVYLLSEDGSHLISKIYSIDSKASKTIEKLTGFSIKDYKIPLHPGSMLSEILRTKKPLLVEDIEEAIKSHTDRKELKLLAKPIAKMTGIKFGIGTPLIAKGRTVGLIGIASRQQLTSLDIERLEAFADQAAIAIERTRMYEVLRESEEKYRDLYDNAPDMYHTLDKNGIIADCNETGARMLGYKKEEIIGRPITEFATDESKRLFEKDFPCPNKKRRKLNLEREFVRKDGTVFPASLNVFAELDENRKLIKTKAIARDITERKKAEQQIRDILDAAPDMIHVISPDMKIINRNSASKKVFPHIQEGSHCYEAMHKRDKACGHCGVTMVFRDGKKHGHESKLTLPDGKKIIVYSTSAPMSDGNGRVTSVVEIIRDITERKRAEEALQESEERLKVILDSVQTGIMTVDAETHVVVDVNPIAVKMFGAPREEIVGSVCHKHICPAEEGHCPITDLGQTVDRSEHVLLTGEGERVPILKTVTSIMLDGRKHLLESFIDITERKRMEDTLVEAYEELETLDELKSNIIANVTHELRTPLMISEATI